MSRSRKSHMRRPRNVTIAPIGMPSRTLKAATERLARVITGFCPVITPMSFVAASSTRASWMASPKPMLTTIFSRVGACIVFL